MTPSRDGKCSMGYAKSLSQMCVVLNALGIDVVLGETNNSCFVHHSRNLSANAFLESKHTHLLQIDDDMSWNPEAILEMLLKDKEFIAGVGRKKTLDVQFAGVNYTDDDGIPIGELGDREEDVLVKMLYIGGAFTLQKRSVFEKLKSSCNYSSGANGYVFYKDEYRLSDWQTEDYFFCELCRKNNIDVWCYPNMDMGHLGNYDYKVNFFKHLKNNKLEPEEILDKIKKTMESWKK